MKETLFSQQGGEIEEKENTLPYSIFKKLQQLYSYIKIIKNCLR